MLQDYSAKVQVVLTACGNHDCELCVGGGATQEGMCCQNVEMSDRNRLT